MFFGYLLLQLVGVGVCVVAGGALYPWGPSHGDILLLPPPPPVATPPPPPDPLASLQFSINLTQGSFRYFGITHNSLVLNKQGLLAFNHVERRYLSPQDIAVTATATFMPPFAIFPLLAEVDPYRGSLQYRESTNRSLLLEVTRDVKAAFPSLKEVALDWALIVTWADLSFWEPPYYQTPNCSCAPKRNTFQAVLASSGPRSFVVFNYDKIFWTKNPWSEWEGANYLRNANCPQPLPVPVPMERINGGSVAGFKFSPVPPNFNSDNPVYTLPGPVMNLTERSNMRPEVKGRWVFRVDDVLQGNGSCAFEENIEQIRIDPDYICHLGHVPLRIQGPCLLNVSNVECRFHEVGVSHPLVTKGVVGSDSSHVICPAPILQTSNGRVRLELSFTKTVPGPSGVDGKEDRTYSGSFFTYPPSSGRRLSLDIRSDGEVHLSWDPSSFMGPIVWDPVTSLGSSSTSGSDLLLQLTLVVLDISSGNGQRAAFPETKIKNSFYNKGTFTWPLGSSGLFNNPKVGYFAYLTPAGAGDESSFPSTFLHSNIVYTNAFTTKEQYAALCEDWYSKDPGVPDTLTPCPPLLDQAIFDWNFLREWGRGPSSPSGLASFRSRLPSPTGSCQRCVYSEVEGRLLLDPPLAGTADLECSGRILAHQMKDVLPCHYCRAAGNPESLAKYVEKRSTFSSQGRGYAPPRPSFWRGDPHFTTWDNATFTFNPVGEFWLFKGQEVVVQARMSQYLKTNGSVFTGFVMAQKSPSATVQVTLGGTGIRVWVNREEVDPPTAPQPQPILISSPGVSMALHKPGLELERVSLAYSSGLTFDISLVPGENALNVVASIAASLKNMMAMTGLLGDFDGVAGNDLRLPVGVVGGITPPNSSLGDINRWGLHWRTTPPESIFLYQTGNSHADYQNVDFIPNLAEVNSSYFPRKVLDLCGGLRECLFDYGTTGSMAMAKATKEVALGMEDIEQVFKRKPPLPCTQPHCVDVTHYTPRPTTPTTPFSGGGGGVTDTHGGLVTGVTTKKPVPGAAPMTFTTTTALRFISSIIFFLIV